MTTPEGTQPPTGPQDPYATPAGGGPGAGPYGTPAPGGSYGAPPPGPYGSPAPGPYGSAAPGPYGSAPAGDDRPTDVVSVLGLVLAFLLAPVGLVLSLVGLARTAGGKRKGRGIAVAGVIVSVVLTLLLVVAVVALVALGQFALQESGVTIEELRELSTAEPFTIEPFPVEP